MPGSARSKWLKAVMRSLRFMNDGLFPVSMWFAMPGRRRSYGLRRCASIHSTPAHALRRRNLACRQTRVISRLAGDAAVALRIPDQTAEVARCVSQADDRRRCFSAGRIRAGGLLARIDALQASVAARGARSTCAPRTAEHAQRSAFSAKAARPRLSVD